MSAYMCVRCHRERMSSNPKAADWAGTVCPVCTLSARDEQRKQKQR